MSDAVLVKWILRFRFLESQWKLRSSIAPVFACIFLVFYLLGYGLDQIIPQIEGISYYHFFSTAFLICIAFSLAFSEAFLNCTLSSSRNISWLRNLKSLGFNPRVTFWGELIWSALWAITLTLFLVVIFFVFGASIRMNLTLSLGWLIALILVTLDGAALGFLLGRLLSGNRFNPSLVATFLVLSLILTSGAFFPVSLYDKSALILVQLNPLKHGVELLRSSSGVILMELQYLLAPGGILIFQFLCLAYLSIRVTQR